MATTFFAPRTARIQLYDYSYIGSLKNDYRIGLSENLWKELIRESNSDDENRTTLKSSICVAITPISSNRKNPLQKYYERSFSSPIFSTIIAYGKWQSPGKYEKAPQVSVTEHYPINIEYCTYKTE